MKETIWKAVGEISDPLISEADKETVRQYFKSKKEKRKRIIEFGSLAACLCLAVFLITFDIRILNQMKTNSWLKTEKGDALGDIGNSGLPNIGPSYGLVGAPDYDKEDEEINRFQNLNFSLLSVFANEERECDTVFIGIHTDHWIPNADGYVKKLYIRCDSAEMTGVRGFGRELPKTKIGGEDFFLLNTEEPNSVYHLDLYLLCSFPSGTLTGEEVRAGALRFTVFLNGTAESCRGDIKLGYDPGNLDVYEQVEIYGSAEELRSVRKVILPTRFPTEATLVNQILYYPAVDLFSLTYKTANTAESFGVGARPQETGYGGQKKETYTYNGTTYTIVKSEAGYAYPPFEVVFWDNGSFYTVYVDVRMEFDVYAFIRGFSDQ